jgi:FtsH-binding integral membrane protein
MSRSLTEPDPPRPSLPVEATGSSISRAIGPDTRLVRAGLLALGDALSFVIFAALGTHSHQQSDNVFWVAFPFAAAWFLVSPFLGAFNRRDTTGLARMVRHTEIGWLAAWPLALVLRWVFSADHQVPLSFALVILIANAVFLGVWRGAFALVEGWREKKGHSPVTGDS